MLRELLNPKFTESQQHYQYRQWLAVLSRYELEARQPLDDNLKIATLVNGLRGNLQQHLLLSVKPTSTWPNVREIVDNYYSSTFVPNPTTGHIAYLAHGSPEDQVNYIKGRRKGPGKGKGGKGKKGGDNYKGKGKRKGKGKQGDYNKGKGKGYNKGGERKLPRMEFMEPRRSRILPQQQQRTRKRKRKRRKGKCYYSMPRLQEVRTCGSQLLVQGLYLHYSSCWFRHYWSETQHYSMDHPTNDQPPRDQRPIYNQHGQCVSGSYMQATTAPRAATSSTASYITTPGPILHDISHVDCGEIDDVLLEPVLHPVQLLTATGVYPHQGLRDKDNTTGFWKTIFLRSLLQHRCEEDTTWFAGYSTRRHSTESTRHSYVFKKVMLKSHYCSMTSTST